MKKFLLFGLLLVYSAAGGVEKGMPRAAVIAELGEPDGSMKNNGKEILLFKTGTVTLQGGAVIGTDLSQKYAHDAEERALKAKEILAAEQAELERQKLLYPEDNVIRIDCGYSKNENWDYLPEFIRPAAGKYGYDVYIPPGYHESGSKKYTCLFLESSVFWDSVKERVRKEKWVAVILHDAPQQQTGKTMNGNFLAAYDDVTRQFRISGEYRFIAGRIPAAIFAAMRPVAGIILQEPDFGGLRKNGIALDFLRKNPNLRAYVLLGDKDPENVHAQGQYIIDRIPKYGIEPYKGKTDILPPPLADNAFDWMKKEYNIH